METLVMTLDPEQLRRSMRAWSSGVTIVTANHKGDRHGMTVSSFTSVSLEPPLIVVSLHTDSRTHRLISASGAFAVNILSAGQQALSERFSGGGAAQDDRFAGVDTETLITGAPAFTESLAVLDCRVRQEIPVGMNTLFLAEVVGTRGDGEGQPLVYHNRQYRRFGTPSQASPKGEGEDPTATRS
ncbi:MAG: flavin reductase family protein [Bacteroidota bacterium]